MVACIKFNNSKKLIEPKQSLATNFSANHLIKSINKPWIVYLCMYILKSQNNNKENKKKLKKQEGVVNDSLPCPLLTG